MKTLRQSRFLFDKKPTSSSGNLDKLSQTLDTSTQINRTLGYGFVAIMFYIFLIVSSTTDLQLFLPDSTVRMPILDVELPLIGFYIIVPFIILIFHFNLLINLKQHQEKYKRWRAKAGLNADTNLLDPILINFLDNYSKKSLIRIVLVIVTSVSIFYFPLINLVVMLWRFGDFHGFPISTWQFIAVLFDCIMIYYFFNRIFLDTSSLKPTKENFSLIKNYFIAIFIISSCFLWYISLLLYIKKDNNTLEIPWIISDYFLPIIDLRNSVDELGKVSDGMVLYYLNKGLSVSDAKLKALENFGKPLKLEGRDLRYALLNGLSLPGVNFKGCLLDEADFNWANLNKANFEFSSCRGTKFNYSKANGAKFAGADLEGSYFNNTELVGSIFTDARAQISQFCGAFLQGAEMSGAVLDGSDFKFANLSCAKLFQAQCRGAVFDHASLNGTDLQDSQFQGSSLKNSKIHPINLDFRGFSGVDFSFSDINLNVDSLGLCDMIDSLVFDNINFTNVTTKDFYIDSIIGQEYLNDDYYFRMKSILQYDAILFNNYRGITQIKRINILKKLACKNRFVSYGIICQIGLNNIYMNSECLDTLEFVSKKWPYIGRNLN